MITICYTLQIRVHKDSRRAKMFSTGTVMDATAGVQLGPLVPGLNLLTVDHGDGAEAHVGLESQCPMKPQRFLRKPELTKKVGLSATTIFNLEKKNEFPKRFSISQRCSGWNLAEVEAWMAAKCILPSQGRVVQNTRRREITSRTIGSAIAGNPFIHLFSSISSNKKGVRAK